ncbi:rCG62715, isoform CRA_b [Rattus norvegicus]|uniref:RCG62715, isoform CRA_b n=1 Tax=Rattus norvegicus TaxID=10116 RepID=A6J6F3_RAT|nr:rCG62715, isoform CRA_b [Rattus norvegicus]
MSFLSSTFHSLGIFEKISGIKEALKNRLLDITQRQYRAGGQQRKRPHTIIQGLLRWGLPVSWSRFLWRQPGEFPVTAFLLGTGTGGLLAIGKSLSALGEPHEHLRGAEGGGVVWLDKLGGHRLGHLPSHPLCQSPVGTQDAGQRRQTLYHGICSGFHLQRAAKTH